VASWASITPGSKPIRITASSGPSLQPAEKSAARKRPGRAFEEAIKALWDFDEKIAHEKYGNAFSARPRHTYDAHHQDAHMLWQFIAQREACALRDAQQVMSVIDVLPKRRIK
jgi:hypothetical protein